MPRAPALVEVFLDGGTGMAPPGSWQITRRWKNHGYVRRLFPADLVTSLPKAWTCLWPRFGAETRAA